MKVFTLGFAILFYFSFLSLGIGQELSIQLDHIVDQYHYDGPGVSIMITQDGQDIYHKAVGISDVELADTLSTDHIFRIGSITKQFTAVAILRMVERGTICLDDPLVEFISDYPDPDRKITVQHLLTHTSGIKSYTELDYWRTYMEEPISVDQVIDIIAQEPRDFNPGDQFSYNNSGYYLLGRIIEVVSGLTYKDYIDRDLLTPLNMEHTYYGDGDFSSSLRAIGYVVDEHGDYRIADSLHMDHAYAAGALVSTVSDLHTWYRAVASGHLMSAAMLDQAWSPYQLNNGAYTNYGYGWYLNQVDDTEVIRHGGGINGFSTASAYLPAEDIFIAVMSNCQQYPSDGLMKKLLIACLGLPSDEPSPISLSHEELLPYAGDYELPDGQVIRIFLDGNKLIGQTSWQPKEELVPTDEHIFHIPTQGFKVRFNMNSRDESKSLTIYSGKIETAVRM